MGLRSHFSRFLIVGCLNTGLDFVLFFLFANVFRITPVVSSLFSSGVTMIVSFYLNHRYVFQSDKSARQTVVQFVGTTVTTVGGVQSVIIYAVTHMHVHFFAEHLWIRNLAAKLCGVAVSFILNFIAYRYIFHNEKLEEFEAI